MENLRAILDSQKADWSRIFPPLGETHTLLPLCDVHGRRETSLLCEPMQLIWLHCN